MSYTLAGFIADVVGNEGHLIQGDPVIESGGVLKYASSVWWSWGDLRDLRQEDRPFVHLFDVERPTPIAEGQTVWLAGRNFYNDANRAIGGFERQTGGWSTYSRGYRWTIGRPSAFKEFETRLSVELGQILRKAIAAGSLESAEAEAAARVYEVLQGDNSRDRFVTLALYYKTKGEDYSLALIRDEAVLSRVFPFRWALDVSVAAMRSRLKARKRKAFVQAPHSVTLSLPALRGVDPDYVSSVNENLFIVDDFNAKRLLEPRFRSYLDAARRAREVIDRENELHERQ